jgi:hypothetical protein
MSETEPRPRKPANPLSLCVARTAGQRSARRRVLAIVGEQEVTVVALDTGEILSAHRIQPDKGYWRNTRRDPDRWPGSPQTG